MSSQIRHTADSVALHFDIWTEHLANQGFQTTKFDDEKLVVGWKVNNGNQWDKYTKLVFYSLLTAKLPRAALAALCTSLSWLLNRKRIGSNVSRPTGRTSFSVISAKARAALRWRSTLSEKDSVVKAERGDPAKKLVVVLSSLYHMNFNNNLTKLSSAYSRDIAKGPPLLLARFPAAMAHTLATCANGLKLLTSLIFTTKTREQPTA